MSTKVRRSVASTPERTAMETWEKICELLAPDPQSPARAELAKVAGVAASTISSEGPKNDAITVHGGGPRAVIYCIYGDDAVSGDGVEEDAFSKSPTQDDWKMSLPIPKEDLEWSQRKLKSCSTRVTARAVGKDLEEDDQNSAAVRQSEPVIDMKEFLKP
jgi:hypothetical protein